MPATYVAFPIPPEAMPGVLAMERENVRAMRAAPNDDKPEAREWWQPEIQEAERRLRVVETEQTWTGDPSDLRDDAKNELEDGLDWDTPAETLALAAFLCACLAELPVKP